GFACQIKRFSKLPVNKCFSKNHLYFKLQLLKYIFTGSLNAHVDGPKSTVACTIFQKLSVIGCSKEHATPWKSLSTSPEWLTVNVLCPTKKLLNSISFRP